MSKPFNLDAVTSERDESPDPFRFTFGGEEFTMPTADDIGVVMIADLEDARVGKSLRILLGETQWARVVKLAGKGHHMTAEQAGAVITAWGEHGGVTVGESSASADS